MTGLVPVIHAVERSEARRLIWQSSNNTSTWMPGTSPGTTESDSPAAKVSAYPGYDGSIPYLRTNSAVPFPWPVLIVACAEFGPVRVIVTTMLLSP